MEIPQIIKQEKVVYNETEPDVNCETNNILESMEIKVESIKIEPHSYLPEHNNLFEKCNLMEETKTKYGNYDKCMSSCSLNEISNQNGLEVKLEGSEAIENMDDVLDVKWAIKHEELNIKEEDDIEDEDHREASTLVSGQQQRNMHEHSDMYKCDQCNYQTVYKQELTSHKLNHNNTDQVDTYKCDYQTFYKSYLKKQSVIYKNSNEAGMYKCEQCDYQTKRKMYLKYHSSKHKNSNEVKKYKCELCEFQTVYKNYLKTHSLKYCCFNKDM